MWESASSISKVCGKGGKQHHRFPGFPQTVISTACFDHRELSGGDLHRSIHPVLLELHRADVVQRRVHSCSVIPEQPCDTAKSPRFSPIKGATQQSFSAVQTVWRRERDSNPRYGFPYSGFQDRLFTAKSPRFSPIKGATQQSFSAVQTVWRRMQS